MKNELNKKRQYKKIFALLHRANSLLDKAYQAHLSSTHKKAS